MFLIMTLELKMEFHKSKVYLNITSNSFSLKTSDFHTLSNNSIFIRAVGTMKYVNDAPVVVMRGSYEYVDGGVTYEVTWVADENGFQPSAPKSKHLPTPVAIPFPEQQAAVDAQIRFAEEETRLRAAASTRSSSNSGSYIAADLSNYSEESRRRI